jgi:hypothetical protein
MHRKPRLSRRPSRRAKPAASSEPQIIYDGQTMRGSIIRRENHFIARDARGRKIGAFASAKAAFAAVLAAPIRGAA